MLKQTLSAAILAAAFFASGTSSAAVFEYVFSGSASGTLGGTSFNGSFTFVGVGDSDNRVTTSPDRYRVVHDSATIEIAGLGTFSILDPTRTQADAAFGGVSLHRDTDGFNFISGPTSAELIGWEMTTAIGPVSGFGGVTSGGIATSGGTLSFGDFPITTTFEARPVPLPPAFLLLLSAIAGIVATKRKT